MTASNDPGTYLTIAECQKRRQETADAIRDLLSEFTLDTGLRVEDVDVEPIYSFGGGVVYLVALEVKL